MKNILDLFPFGITILTFRNTTGRGIKSERKEQKGYYEITSDILC